MDYIITSFITGVLSIIGVLITVRGNYKKINNDIEIKLAVIDERLDHLIVEVEKHNNYGIELASLKGRLDTLEKSF